MDFFSDVTFLRPFFARLCVAEIRRYLSIECSESGDSFWKDLHGRGFKTDVGYFYEGLEVFADYLTEILEEKVREKLS